MKRLLKMFEDTMAAVAFAEEGEFETARKILHEEKPLPEEIEELKHKVDLTVSDLTSMAITFAEAGEFKIAVEILKETEENVERVKKIYQRISNNMALAVRLSRS